MELLDVLRAAGAGQARLSCICAERKESANVIVALCRAGDRERLAMQQQARSDGRDLAGLPRPEPFTLPSRQARALNPIGEAES